MFRKPSSTAPSTAPTGSKEGTSHPFTEFSLRWEAENGRAPACCRSGFRTTFHREETSARTSAPDVGCCYGLLTSLLERSSSPEPWPSRNCLHPTHPSTRSSASSLVLQRW